MEQLQKQLVDLINVLTSLPPAHLHRLFQLIHFDLEQFHLSQLSTLVSRAQPHQLQYCILECINSELDPIGREFIGQLSAAQRTSFSMVYQLFEVQSLSHELLSIEQLLKLLDVLPHAATFDQRLQLLQYLQQLLLDINDDMLLSLRDEVHSNNQCSLVQLLDMQPQDPRVIVCDPLRSLLSAPSDDMLQIKRVLPTLRPYQLCCLVMLAELDSFEVLELRQLLSRNYKDGANGLQSIDPPMMDTETVLSLRILDQPPERSVYKRNLKPNPSVLVVGNPSELEYNDTLFVVPVLVRCDTQQVVPDKLQGASPVKVTPGSFTPFRRLKVLVTSHQLDETLFALRFELQRHRNGVYLETLSYVQSNPIAVVSHSTQMKSTPAVSSPVVYEICPSYGSTTGGMRVAIIGHNFVESPEARVKFADTYVVVPDFHDNGTIVCTIPQHYLSEVVQVRVSNDSKRWSDTSTTFQYIDTSIALS